MSGCDYVLPAPLVRKMEPSRPQPRCFDCLSEDVAVKVIDLCGFEHWLCAEDWAAQRELSGKIMKLLGDAVEQLKEPATQPGQWSPQRTAPGPIIAYKIDGKIYHPADVEIVRADP